MDNTSNWYESWFDSPFYHILYGNRDEEEARRFIDVLINFLQPTQGDSFMDLACGKGRHALAIHRHGYPVCGIDLSENSIREARALETTGLEFHVHDMRDVFRPQGFQYIFNLFTSFGYFEHANDLYQTMDAIAAQLKPGGTLVLDYLNTRAADRFIGNGYQDKIEREGILFHIEKKIRDQFISKSINFTVDQKKFHFEEHIWRLDESDFTKLCDHAGLSIQTIFGDYQLGEFNPELSDRFILIARKD
ncbi:MAG: class I SAM-dependent methyltransferase [Bacteroidetes bacterium]|nr:class I SAM-dependent methyltransferase [Bacteroidota bacterium]